ncbi:branched-chain amino acid transport ATP-binding protein LivF [Halarchaeum acidiphilum MH1-52-1]|uniref:Branched-chain amino acid transport ATP-binding protein LivF n=1 Tax=Halarchaeum acidiphilum MH1-52-1 TaxID=1261545 RepID=U2YS62_9EURY|nr:ABC transporter ATP-binding protein [Halarchaeum acidiphilum]GAD51815.1 branched-chain amino acid transport ATP-binding protein LivF [Halarchaeum acidiphilum MH1-52-1]
MSEILTADGITAGYGEGAVLHDVSLSVEQDSITSIIGRNGVGKTTTLRTIMGLIDPISGSVTFDGEDITDLSTTERYQQRIGMVLEGRGIFPELTVRENLQVPRLHSESNSWQMERIFEYFPNLAELQDSKAKNLSGGEQQMLALGRAIRPNPRVLLLDEPTEGLAPQIVENVRDVIEEMADLGTTILLVEQNVELTLEVSSYNYVMENGKIVSEGTSQEIRESGVIKRHLGISAAMN